MTVTKPLFSLLFFLLQQCIVRGFSLVEPRLIRFDRLSRERTSVNLTNGETDLGELAVSQPSPLDLTLVESAKERLPWEDHGDTLEQDGIAWESGSTWHETRVKLVNLWVLPRDMSNGAWESYALAASKGEQKLLSQAPQLLRLSTDEVVQSAKTVLNDLGMPPAVLRSHPILFTMTSEQLLESYAALQSEMNDSNFELKTKCRDEPEILVQRARLQYPST